MSLRSFPDDVSKKCPSKPQPKRTDYNDGHFPGYIFHSYNIQVITPIFGGGSEAGTNDPVTPIRGSTIRGNLRFWWRATRGAACKSVAELRQREGEIWGTPDNPSPVAIEVKVGKLQGKRECRNDHDFPRFGSEAYVLFSAKQEQRDILREGFSFCLTIRWLKHERLQELRDRENETRRREKRKLLPPIIEDISPDIEAALWAWANFGGIGARTRRGCGAPFCKDFAPASRNELITGIKKVMLGVTHEQENDTGKWPVMKKVLFGEANTTQYEKSTSLDAWRAVITVMQEFRQKLDFGRAKGSGTAGRDKFGRSFWPEADSLRGITDKGDPAHKKSQTVPNPKDAPAFPRSELGLPIVFHFIDRDDQPNNCELYPKGFSRMSSPVILRPLVFSKGTPVEPMIVVLTPGILDGLELHGIKNPPPLNSNNIRRPDLSTYANSPLGTKDKSDSPYSRSGSALEGFLNFAKDKGFQEQWP